MPIISAAGLHTLPQDSDVLISGGGPSGLFLALELSFRGIRSTVIEPRTVIDSDRPRAKTTNARTMTHLRRLGLANALRAAAPLPVAYSQDVIFCTSLTGRELTRFRNAFQLAAGRYDLQPECGQQVPQPVVEETLRAAVGASEHATLCTGLKVVSVAPGSPHAPSHVRIGDAEGNEREVSCRYLVGADGGASAVRGGLGISLEGDSAARSNLSVLFRSPDLASKVTLDPAVQYWAITDSAAGMVGRVDLKDTWWAILQGVDIGREDLDPAALVRSLAGADFEMDIIATDPWTARMLLAPEYGRDNVFIIGDAAHLNPPWGGHGFNTCIGDAVNLGWKLAAALQGWAGPSLLESYGQERRPVAVRTIRDAEANGRALAYDFADDHLDKAGPDGDRARVAVKEALTVKRTEFEALGLVLGYSYAQSSLTTPDGAMPPPEDPVQYLPSASAGSLLPHVWLDEETSIYDLLGAGFTLLVDGGLLNGPAAAEVYAPVLEEAYLRNIPLAIRSVDHPRSAADVALDSLWQAAAVLVRPDQHVAWRGESAADAAAALLTAAGWAADPANPTAEEMTNSANAVLS